MNQTQTETSLLSDEVDDDNLSASETVYTKLKLEIMNGKILPGTLLTESVIANQYNTSRTPVRKALTMLASDGLISTLPKRGHLVRTISVAELLGAFRVREILEVEAVDQAVGRITKDELARLKELVAEKDNPDLPSLNLEFHVAIARASGNRVLIEFIERLLLLMHGLLLLDPHLAAWEKEGGMEEEKTIIELLEARDRVGACEAMRTHIRNTLNVILGRLETPQRRYP